MLCFLSVKQFIFLYTIYYEWLSLVCSLWVHDSAALFINADGCRRCRFFTFVCLCVFLHDNSKTNAARITKLHIEMFHDESWKLVSFGSKGQGHESQNSAGMGLYILWVLASCSIFSSDSVGSLRGMETGLLKTCTEWFQTFLCCNREWGSNWQSHLKRKNWHVLNATLMLRSAAWLLFNESRVSVRCRNASLHEKLFLRAVLAEFGRTGVEEAVFRCVYRQHVSLCRFDGITNLLLMSTLHDVSRTTGH